MSNNLIINGITYNNIDTMTFKDSNNENVVFEPTTSDSLLNSILDGTISGQYINNSITTVASHIFQYCTNLTGVSLESCKLIGSYAFASCSSLQTVYAPSCMYISAYAFTSCSQLSSVSMSVCVSVGTLAFAYCSNLSYISFPVCTSIGDSAFASCTSLTQAIFPSCQYVNGFNECTSLSVISFPECISIGSRAFLRCEALTQVSFPKCTTIGPYYVFGSCSNLTNISIPLVTSIGIQAFMYCSKLSIISLPKCEEIDIGTFEGCVSLAKVYCCWNNNLILYSTAFKTCQRLLSLYLVGSNIATLSNINVFQTTPISNYTVETGGVYGSIFVPASLFDSYKISTNWVTYSSRFASLTDAQVSQIKTQMGIT